MVCQLTIFFVLINLKPDEEGLEEVEAEVNRIPHVLESHIVFGRCDIIAKIETDTMSDLAEIIRYKIRPISGVEKTETLTVWEEGQKQKENQKLSIE